MNTEDIKGRMVFYNSWWREKKVTKELAPLFKREVFAKIESYLNLPRVIVLKGPRRTGKSTLVYQLIEKLLNGGTAAENILYLNFEDPILRFDFHKLLKFYEEITEVDLEEKGRKYIFLDEVQLLPFWAEGVKAFFDKKYPLKFICLGSSSTLLQKGGESLAGRSIEEIVLPFNFREWANYQLFKKKTEISINSQNYLLFQKEMETLSNKYLERGGFAHILDIPEEELIKKMIYEDIVQKVIYRDLVEVYNIREPAILEKVFYYLIQISGQVLNVSSLSQTLALNRETLRSYLTYLNSAYLYFTIPKFSHSIKQVLGSGEKAHLIDPVFSLLGLNKEISFKFETAIACYFHELYPHDLYYFREIEEVDLVIARGRELIPIEIKSGERITARELKGLFKFMEKYKVKKGYVVYRGEEKKEKFGSKTVYFLSGFKMMYLGEGVDG